MSSFMPLPIRLANNDNDAAAALLEDSADRESPQPPSPVKSPEDGGRDSTAEPSLSLKLLSIVDGEPNTTAGPIVTSPELKLEAAAGPSNHQFWLKDAKIAEDLFTIHRSAKHLLEFTSSMIGNHDSTLAQRPIPVMSDGDVLFMTQLSNDIARSVGGISAVRHHGQRVRKRNKIRHPNGFNHGHGDAGPSKPHHHEHNSSFQRHSRESKNGSGKRHHQQMTKSDDELTCSRCGRTETPEWRKGPDGLLCNVCGLVYAKQRRKLKGG